LEFIIATASRSGAARVAKYSDIDIEVRVWRVPRSDLKDGRDRSHAFVVPLNDITDEQDLPVLRHARDPRQASNLR
jgi:hypothetical protein